MSVVLNRDSEGSRQSKICKLKNAILGDEEVLRLQVSVKNPVLVTMSNPVQKLVQKRFHCCHVEAVFWRIVKQLLQILVQEFKDKSKLLISVNHIVKLHNVFVLKFFQQCDFSDRCGRDTFIFRFQPNLLQCY